MAAPKVFGMKCICDNGAGTFGYVYRLWAKPLRRWWERTRGR